MPDKRLSADAHPESSAGDQNNGAPEQIEQTLDDQAHSEHG